MEEIFHKERWATPLLTLDSGKPGLTSPEPDETKENKRPMAPSPENTSSAKRKYFT